MTALSYAFSLLCCTLSISAASNLFRCLSGAAADLFSRPPCGRPAIRKDWAFWRLEERVNYIASVKCLMSMPSRIPAGLAPGAVNRYDDFIGTHINQTLFIHSEGTFLVWHRHYIWLYAEALKEECGYRGPVPYWNWPLHPNLTASPLFDNSPASFGGDGVYEQNATIPTFGNGTLPRGTGGGCVVEGPFANRTLHFRNFGQSEAREVNGTLPNNSLEYNPHCFRRDLNTYFLEHFTRQIDVDDLLYKSTNISTLRRRCDGVTGTTAQGVHNGGHYLAGPDHFDFFASPSDPVFFLHHGMIDLIYTLWQAQDPIARQYALSGTSTTFNVPPSANVTLDYELNFGCLGRPRKIGELMDVNKGPYCYRYEY